MADKYIDFSATNDGDGTTPAQAASPGGVGAWNKLSSASVVGADKVWMRRVGTDTITLDHTFSVASVSWIGWPKVQDPEYAGRTAAGISQGWDSDGGDYPLVTCSVSFRRLIVNASGIKVHRIKYNNTNVTNTGEVFRVTTSGTNADLYEVFVDSDSTSSAAINIFSINAKCTVKKCTVDSLSTAVSAGGLFGVATTAGDSKLIQCNTLGTSELYSYYNFGISCLFDSCTVNTTGTNNRGFFLVVPSNVKIFVINCEAILSSGTTNQPMQLDGGNGTIEIRNFKCRGRFLTLTCPGGTYNIKKFTQTGSSTFGMNVGRNCVLVVENVTFSAGNTNNFQLGDNTLVLGRNVVMAGNPVYDTTIRVWPGIFISDYDGVVNDWKMVNSLGKIESSAVVRTGGETFSAKFELTVNNPTTLPNEAGVELGKEGFETIWVNVTSGGARTVTIYGAYKGWGATPPTKDNIWLDSDYLDTGSGASRALATSRTALADALTSDSSVWTGDTGLTSFKLEIVFTPLQTGLVPIRIRHTQYVASAIVYIDPKPIVT